MFIEMAWVFFYSPRFWKTRCNFLVILSIQWDLLKVCYGLCVLDDALYATDSDINKTSHLPSDHLQYNGEIGK